MNGETISIQGLKTIAFNEGRPIALVGLHGYGANHRDLVSIREFIADAQSYDWYFPNGPLAVPIGIGMQGRGWFPFRMEQLGIDFSQKNPEGLDRASEQVKALVEELQKDYDKVYLGGFSQGAMVSANLTLQWPELIQKLFMLSGTLLREQDWRQWFEGAGHILSFQSHGRDDAILPLSAAKALSRIFEQGPNHEFHEFSGGHEISPSVLQSLSRFLYG